MIGPHLGWMVLLANPLLLTACILVLRSPFIGKPDALSIIARKMVRMMDRLSNGLMTAVKWFALGMVLLTAMLVVGRYVFGVGSLKGQEAVIYMHALLFLLAGAATLQHEGHVRVDIFYAKLSVKKRAIIDFAGTILFLIPVCLLILIYANSYVAMAWKFHEGSPEADGLPFVYLLKTAIPAFALLMLFQGSSQALRAALTLTNQPMKPAKPQEAQV